MAITIIGSLDFLIQTKTLLILLTNKVLIYNMDLRLNFFGLLK